MKIYIDSTRAFFSLVTSSLIGCYALWLYQGCHYFPPFISFFAHGLSAYVFAYGISASSLIAANVMRQVEVLRRKHASLRGSKILKAQSYVSLFFGLSGIVGMCSVCYYPWNYQDGKEHAIAAVASFITIATWQATHTAGTIYLWRKEKAEWASSIIAQICVIGFNTFCAVLFVFQMFFVYDVGAVSFATTRKLPNNTETFLTFCRAGYFNAAGFSSDMQKEAHLMAMLEWGIFASMSLFLWAAPDPPIPDSLYCDENTKQHCSKKMPLLREGDWDGRIQQPEKMEVESPTTTTTNGDFPPTNPPSNRGLVESLVSPICITNGLATKNSSFSVGKGSPLSKGMSFTNKNIRMAAEFP